MGACGGGGRALAEALRLRPGYPAAHDNLGRVLKAQGRAAEAVAQHRAALAGKARPGNPQQPAVLPKLSRRTSRPGMWPPSTVLGPACTSSSQGRADRRLGTVRPSPAPPGRLCLARPREPFGLVFFLAGPRGARPGKLRDHLLLGRPHSGPRHPAVAVARRTLEGHRRLDRCPGRGGRPGRRNRHPGRPCRPHRPQPAAGVRAKAGPGPGNLARLPEHDGAGGDGLPDHRGGQRPTRADRGMAQRGTRAPAAELLLLRAMPRVARRSARFRPWLPGT